MVHTLLKRPRLKSGGSYTERIENKSIQDQTDRELYRKQLEESQTSMNNLFEMIKKGINDELIKIVFDVFVDRVDVMEDGTFNVTSRYHTSDSGCGLQDGGGSRDRTGDLLNAIS